MHASTFLQVLNSQSVWVMRLLSFYKQIPEFNQLNVEDKVTLIKFNLSAALGISSALSFNTQTKQMIESDSDAPLNVEFFRVLHGHKMSLQLRSTFSSFLRIANHDRKIVQLALIILIATTGFSLITDPNNRILNDSLAVFHIQNYYTELLCKYMTTMYGYEKALELFSELMFRVITWQLLHEKLRDKIFEVLSPEDINELVPIMRSILRI